MQIKLEKIVILLSKLLCIGLLLHFFLYNLFTFSFGIQFEAIWLWKELIIVLLILSLFVLVLLKKNWLFLFDNKTVLTMEIIFLLTVIWSLAVSLFHWQSVGEYFFAFRYDFLWFAIFFLAIHLWNYLPKESIVSMEKFYVSAMKWILILAVVWYLVIAVKPWALKFFGYDRNVYEAKMWERPPAVYYTQMNHWIARNQFVFERPISYGFFLTALFPLFYFYVLRRRSFEKTWAWWGLFGLNVVLTFSRAAWGAWILEVLLLWILEHKNNLKRFFLKIMLPIVVIAWAIVWLAYNQVVMRYFSNSWHFQLLEESAKMFLQDPWLWRWAGAAWPASHRLCSVEAQSDLCMEISQINKRLWMTNLVGYNTENQYLQVLIEYGAIVFIGWFAIFAFLCLFPFYIYFKTAEKKLHNEHWILICFATWMLWLALEAVVLHSFVDRMIVFPMMLLYGFAFAAYFKLKQ